MGLFGIGKKKGHDIKIQFRAFENGKEVQIRESQVSEDWQKDLTVMHNIKEQIKPLEDVFVKCAVALKSRQTVDDEIAILEKMIEYYMTARHKCYSMGPDYTDYFNRSWDKIKKEKNGEVTYVCYISAAQDRLRHVKKHYSELKETERQYQEQSENLEERLISYLRVSCPVLQSEIYKSFGSLVKDDIRDLLYHMEKSGKVKREKSGRSYIVTIK